MSSPANPATTIGGYTPIDREGHRAYWIAAAAILPALSYLLARYINFGPETGDTGPWAYWPTHGILCGIFYRRVYRDWVPIGVLAALSQILTIYLDRGQLLPGGATVIGALVGVTQSTICAVVLRYACRKRGPLTRASDVAWFVGVAVCLVPLVTTLFSGAVYSRALNISFSAAWIPLFAGNSLSILIFAPPVVFFKRDEDTSGPWRAGAVECVVGQMAILGMAVLIFAAPPTLLRFVALPFALIPMLAWSAIRCGCTWTSVGVVGVSTIAAWCTARGMGPFVLVGSMFGDRVLQLQTYLALLAITGILLSSIWEQARQALNSFAIQAGIREGFFNASVSGLLLRDLTGRTVLANAAAASFAQQSKEDIIGKTPSEFAPANAELIQSRDRLVLERGEPMTFDETTQIDNKTRHFVVTRFPVREAGGDIRYIGIIARDTTVERDLTERLYRAQRVEIVGHLAAGIAHDLNNLLTTIKLSTEMVKASGALRGENRELVAGLEEASNTASRLTARLLSLGRARPPQNIAIDVDEAIRALKPMLNVLVRGVVDLRVELGAPQACVFADPLTIEQVVLNLISNARDAIKDAGAVSVTTEIIPASQLRGPASTSEAARWLRLRVADTGIGMDETTLASLFEPFFSTKGDRGTGLGLYTTSMMVRQAGGDINVTSAPGKGTTFTVDLPCSD